MNQQDSSAGASAGPRDGAKPGNSLRARVMAATLGATLKQSLSPRFSLAVQRASAASLKYILLRPGGVRRTALREPGFDGLCAEPATPDADHAVLFLHGGGFVVGGPDTSHLALVMRLAAASGRRVYAPRYRLAPEHRYPAQLEDAYAAWRWLRDRGVDMRALVIAGDSAGGNLALALTQHLRARGEPAPCGLALISPWADVSLVNVDAGASDALLTQAWLAQARDSYVDAAQMQSALVSPLHADFAGFPRAMIQFAAAELFAPDIRRLAQAMSGAGLALTVDEAPGLWHDFQLSAGVVPESDRAVARLGDFIKRCRKA